MRPFARTPRNASGAASTGSANSQNRTTQEGTVGLIQPLVKDPKYGAVQAMFRFFRNPWFAVLRRPKDTHENAVRYMLQTTAPRIRIDELDECPAGKGQAAVSVAPWA